MSITFGQRCSLVGLESCTRPARPQEPQLSRGAWSCAGYNSPPAKNTAHQNPMALHGLWKARIAFSCHGMLSQGGKPFALFMFCSIISSGDTQRLLFVPLPCRTPLGVISSIISLALCTHLHFPTPLIYFFFCVRR